MRRGLLLQDHGAPAGTEVCGCPGGIAQIAEIRGGYDLAIGMRETCMEILRKDWQVTEGELLETYRREEQGRNMTDTAGDFNLRRCFTSATACVHPFFLAVFLQFTWINFL